jgi:DNA modification methylase
MYLEINKIYLGNSTELLSEIEPDSIACSIWSPPYHVGKSYEKGQTYEQWKEMLTKVISLHSTVLKPGGFMVINIGDILCFRDPEMPRIQLPNKTRLSSPVTQNHVLAAMKKHPDFNRYQLAELLGCSEQTIDRRLHGNNIRGGKYATQTRVNLAGGLIQDAALKSKLYLYDRRVWVKDPAWQNSQWHSSSYRSVDEFEYIYIFWKPGETIIDRHRLTSDEWVKWGSRGVWDFASVRANKIHEAMFPLELPLRCIKLFTDPGDIVLDPFMGSGTTAIAAIQLNRKYIGIDKEQKSVSLAMKRIKKSLLQPVLFRS